MKQLLLGAPFIGPLLARLSLFVKRLQRELAGKRLEHDPLAILGGEPLRAHPFVALPMVDRAEERMVLKAIREKNFSRYVSVKVGEDVLTMTSREAAKIKAPWHFLGGPNVRAFAAQFAERFEVPFAIPVNSATTGLSVALAAAGIGPGDEVIVPALSFSASANAVLMFNSIPVFADVDPETFCLDPAAVEAALTPRTRALLVVHLTGNVADMDRLLDIASRHGLKVIEDAAQAIGATWNGQPAGTLGDAGVYSFQQSKHIMTGEGGMIVTRDPEIAKRARLISNHGENVFDEHHAEDDLANVVGFNFRMPELSAALGRAQLPKLDAESRWRLRNADLLYAELADIPGLELPMRQRSGAVPHMFVALFDSKAAGMDRALFVAALRAEGIPVGTGFARPMYAAPTFQKRIAYGRKGCPWTCRQDESPASYRLGQCPTAERLLSERFLWFYMISHPSTARDIRDVGRAVRKVMNNRDALIAAPLKLSDDLAERNTGRIGVASGAKRA